MESTDSSSGSRHLHLHLPPGFRFHPTDEELVVHYLAKKAASVPLPVTIIAEIDLYKFDPWELPSKATFGEQEWYFFSPRDRKYPNGARPNRAATSGYWKATGTDKPILTANGNQKVGVKKALVFYGGKPPKGIKTNWIMHEYRLVENNLSSKPPGADLANKKASLRLDDWVLCRIYKKNNSQRPIEREKEEYSMEGLFGTLHQNLKPPPPGNTSSYGSLVLDHNDANFFEGILSVGSSDQAGGAAASNNINISQQLASSTSKLYNNNNNAKRTTLLPPHYNWNEPSAAGSSSSKRFHGDLNNNNHDHDHHSSSFVSLLNQIPVHGTGAAAPIIHPNALMGSLDDGVLRQQFQKLPSMNWNS